MKYARRTDANHAEMAQAFRDLHCSVWDTSRVPGFVDLVVGIRNLSLLVEIKREKGKLNPNQEKFRAAWRGHYAVVRNVQDVADVVNEAIRGN